ncbi:uncharacterized protein LOC113312301 [Papaver somniferum]|uniref:uncharacterized protein LOC113312301 n=1 Tax=Papaver somniferum TaxID=3469 RepID=UPI000E7033BB|nr:uncharacterized protein LOC113312301 [Papaver somniferum]
MHEDKEILTPAKVLQIVENNSLEKSVVKYINGKDGSVSEERIPTTTWSRIIQKPAASKPASTSIDQTNAAQKAPKTGLQYSWSNCQHGNKIILCNLDRAVYNHLWFQKHIDWGYKVGLRIAFDHAPLLGGCASIPKPPNIPFKFQKMWLSHSNFMEVISQCWNEYVVGDPSFVLLHKLKKLENILKDWNWKVLGDINVQIKETEEEVNKAMELSDNNPSNAEALDRLVNAENNYNSIEVQLNIMLKQKARIKWVKEGSANTSFFHTNLKIRQSRNFISELEDTNGDNISDQNKIADTLVQHFEQKFQYKAAEEVDSLLEVIPYVITK